ncbi:hypothetical protein VOLCADRAFT_108201 [Volvox carteri f. nagariensis]|uniref:Chromosome transmission fidelity protein 8 n=1 Tax=Volvox carteri f. nagariensis TaxID=3068 RepID=D8UIV5_VOLCA|nr:uncharacterized protein VOLCADRAFT_108201 [Volvox carteri f. nagariensis]EFJ40322.1 hypothetical protein VOLCADRAFT_108201 [Volvox carteri f. nagariensis]|eukprot:XP_002958585.1 hypothetical protein VOLCADRAFT_108201 [Volvox carteri f. nagariensis]
MIVPVTCPSGKVIEWVLVELQGKIENLTEDQTSEIGVLLSKDPDGKALQLTIGYHQLEGKRIPLKKPLAILSKCGGTTVAGSSSTSYEVLGVIRIQYLFKTRPRALISKPAGR